MIQDEDLLQKLVDSLREWFDSACQDHCNGHNNLYTPQLTCLDSHTGIIESIVHHEGETSAQMLIDLAIADLQARKPPIVHLSHGWILRLNLTSPEQMHSSFSNESQPIAIRAGIGAGIGAAIAAIILLLCIVGIVIGIHQRFALNLYSDCTDNVIYYVNVNLQWTLVHNRE